MAGSTSISYCFNKDVLILSKGHVYTSAPRNQDESFVFLMPPTTSLSPRPLQIIT